MFAAPLGLYFPNRIPWIIRVSYIAVRVCVPLAYEIHFLVGHLSFKNWESGVIFCFQALSIYAGERSRCKRTNAF